MIAELTRSDLSLVARCPRKYWYAKVLGLEEGPSSKAMSEGTIMHRGLEVAYRTAQGFDLISEDNGEEYRRTHAFMLDCREAGITAMLDMIGEGTYVYRGKTQQLNADTREFDNRERLLDAFSYYMEKRFLESLDNKRVVAIEKDFEYEIQVGPTRMVVAGTLDLVLQDRTDLMYEVWDHKCVGQVKQALRFLALDVQMNVYENMACKALDVEAVVMKYNLIRRDRPPGFGTRPLVTKSGAVSKASVDVADYLYTHPWSHNRTERAFTQDVLERYASTIYYLQTEGDPSGPNRVPIKSGGEACTTSCVYNSRCAAEMLGYAQPTWKPAPIVETQDD